MNIKHPNTKFTSTFEKNDSFSFLDTKIARSKNHLVVSVCCKTLFSGVFTNFKSFFRLVYKFGWGYTLIHRSFSICFSYEKFDEEIVLLNGISK